MAPAGDPEYTGQTLRDHYGIPRPDSQFARPGERVAERVVALRSSLLVTAGPVQA